MLGPRDCITVKCVSPCNGNKFEIAVLDADNHIVFHGKTSKAGTASFNICCFGEYRIRVRSETQLSPGAATRWLFFYPNESYIVYFVFQPFFVKHVIAATFYLTDKNYGGLPIQKGDIQLCQAPIRLTSQMAKGQVGF